MQRRDRDAGDPAKRGCEEVKILEKAQKLKEKVAEIKKLCQDSGAKSDEEIALFMHDYLISHAHYSLDSYEPEGVLLEGSGACESYAKAYRLLLSEMGVKCLLISGTGNGEAHMWNLVSVDGNWYHADCTFDDPVNVEMVDHRYFLISDSSRSFTISASSPSIINPVSSPSIR